MRAFPTVLYARSTVQSGKPIRQGLPTLERRRTEARVRKPRGNSFHGIERPHVDPTCQPSPTAHTPSCASFGTYTEDGELAPPSLAHCASAASSLTGCAAS